MTVYWLGEADGKNVRQFQQGEFGKVVLFRSGGELVIAINDADGEICNLLHKGFLRRFCCYPDKNFAFLHSCRYYVASYGVQDVEPFLQQTGYSLRPVGWCEEEVIIAITGSMGSAVVKLMGDIVISCGSPLTDPVSLNVVSRGLKEVLVSSKLFELQDNAVQTVGGSSLSVAIGQLFLALAGRKLRFMDARSYPVVSANVALVDHMLDRGLF